MLTSSHITRDEAGDVVVVESARFTESYDLLRFEVTNQQAGYSGSVTVTDGRHLDFLLNEGGRITTATERVTDPVVTGPSLHGFILQHWEHLSAGHRLPVRMIVMAKMETYGFKIRQVEAVAGRTAFAITPTSLLVRVAVNPLRVEFDASSRHVVRYQGRVPPMQRVAGTFKPLDADVQYTMRAATYR